MSIYFNLNMLNQIINACKISIGIDTKKRDYIIGQLYN